MEPARRGRPPLRRPQVGPAFHPIAPVPTAPLRLPVAVQPVAASRPPPVRVWTGPVTLPTRGRPPKRPRLDAQPPAAQASSSSNSSSGLQPVSTAAENEQTDDNEFKEFVVQLLTDAMANPAGYAHLLDWSILTQAADYLTSCENESDSS